jgi:PAS domain S-box-containing protein
VDELQLYRSLVDQSPDAVIFADRDGLVRLWNRRAEALFGFSAGELIGKNLDAIIPERMRGRHAEGFRRAVDTGSTKYVDRVLTTRSVHKSGRKLYVELSFGLIKDEARGVIGVMATARDCTERYEARKASQSACQNPGS